MALLMFLIPLQGPQPDNHRPHDGRINLRARPGWRAIESLASRGHVRPLWGVCLVARLSLAHVVIHGPDTGRRTAALIGDGAIRRARNEANGEEGSYQPESRRRTQTFVTQHPTGKRGKFAHSQATL